MKWNPDLAPTPLKQSATDKDCKFSDTSLPLTDSYDTQEPDPIPHPGYFVLPSRTRLKKYKLALQHPDICLTPPLVTDMMGIWPAISDPYTGDSALCFSATPTPLDKTIKKPS